MNLLRSQRNRLENQIANLITITITAQRVVDQRDAEIEALQERQRSSEQRRNDENDEKRARKNNKK